MFSHIEAGIPTIPSMRAKFEVLVEKPSHQTPVTETLCLSDLRQIKAAADIRDSARIALLQERAVGNISLRAVKVASTGAIYRYLEPVPWSSIVPLS